MHMSCGYNYFPVDCKYKASLLSLPPPVTTSEALEPGVRYVWDVVVGEDGPGGREVVGPGGRGLHHGWTGGAPRGFVGPDVERLPEVGLEREDPGDVVPVVETERYL